MSTVNGASAGAPPRAGTAPAREGVALCAVCTAGHLPGAVAMARSAYASWTVPPAAFYLTVVDLASPAEVDGLGVRNVRVFVGNDLGVPDWVWHRTRLDAHQLCALFRPRLVRRALDDGHRSVVYSDNDVWHLADIEPLLEPLAEGSIAVTPHLLSPFPDATALLQPTLSDVFKAGILNSGLFAVRDDGDARGFLADLERVYLGPGSFRSELGSGSDQQAFNWVIALARGVRVVRDRRLNVAYWNLHERTLSHQRRAGRDAWTIDGAPLACFHFSGLPDDGSRLSLHDVRHSTALNAPLAELVERYRRELAAVRAEPWLAALARRPYGYDRAAFLPLDAEVRAAVNRHTLPPRGDAPWTDTAALASLARLYDEVGEALPVAPYLESVWRSRPDLVALQSGPSLHPARLLDWFDCGLRRDHPGLGALHDALAPFAYPRSVAQDLLERAADATPTEEDFETLCTRRYLLCSGRPERDSALLERGPGAEPRFLAQVASQCLRRIYESRPDLAAVFPDPLGDDFAALRGWLRGSLRREYALPAQIAAAIETLDPYQSLARVLCFARRRDELRAALRGGVPLPTLLPRLLPLAQKDLEFGVDDLLLVDWYGELHAAEVATQVAAILPRDAGDGSPPARERRVALADGVEQRAAAVNLFGYHRSPIGLGALTAGLEQGLRRAGGAVHRVVVGCETMDAELLPNDLVPAIDHAARHNVFVTFPHLDYDLLDTYPRSVTAGRQNVAYLAWEQESFHPAWCRRFAAFDRLAALSTFTARSIADATGREVWVWPACLQPPPTLDRADCRRRHELDPSDFVVGFVADARSGLERKNPLACVRAAIAALAGDPHALLVLKVTGGHQAAHRDTLRSLGELLAASRLRHRLITRRMDRSEVEELMGCFDVYLSLHRAEGFGFTIAEAMLRGIPVVATGYSGNMDYMRAGNSLSVAWRYTVIERAEGPFQPGTLWAEPQVEDAAAKLRAVRDGEVDLVTMTARARADVEARCSPTAVAARLREDLGWCPPPRVALPLPALRQLASAQVIR